MIGRVVRVVVGTKGAKSYFAHILIVRPVKMQTTFHADDADMGVLGAKMQLLAAVTPCHAAVAAAAVRRWR